GSTRRPGRPPIPASRSGRTSSEPDGQTRAGGSAAAPRGSPATPRSPPATGCTPPPAPGPAGRHRSRLPLPFAQSAPPRAPGYRSPGPRGTIRCHRFGGPHVSSKVVVIHSGGLDSTTLLYHLRAEGSELVALSADYGQRHRDRELASAAAVCGRLVIE